MHAPDTICSFAPLESQNQGCLNQSSIPSEVSSSKGLHHIKLAGMLTTWVFQTIEGPAKELKNPHSCFQEYSANMQHKAVFVCQRQNSLSVLKSEIGCEQVYLYGFSARQCLCQTTAQSTQDTGIFLLDHLSFDNQSFNGEFHPFLSSASVTLTFRRPRR